MISTELLQLPAFLARRGRYPRIEKRHLEDPLKPYIAPIRDDLPSFHIPIEYTSAENTYHYPSPAPYMHYPHITDGFGGRLMGRVLGAAGRRRDSLGSISNHSGCLPRNTCGDAKVTKTNKKHRKVASEEKMIKREYTRYKEESGIDHTPEMTNSRGGTMIPPFLSRQEEYQPLEMVKIEYHDSYYHYRNPLYFHGFNTMNCNAQASQDQRLIERVEHVVIKQEPAYDA